VDEPKVSVIVLNWNGKRFLGDCIGSLLNQDYFNYEVVFVDNASTDESVEFVKKEFGNSANLKIVVLPENYGFSRGNNLGINHAQGDYVIVLNNDTIVRENFIRELVAVAESDAQIASVGCKILSMNGHTWFSQKFTNGGLIVPLFLQSLVSARVDDVSGRHCVNLANSGCACLFRKQVLRDIGGYDEDFLADWEDWDLGYRINLAGYKSVHTPVPLVSHFGGGSAGYRPERYARIYRNALFAHFKNYSSSNLVTRFAVFTFVLLPLSHLGFVVLHLVVGRRQFRRNESLGYFLSLVKAYAMFLSKLRVFASKRYAVQKLRRTSDKEIFRNTKSRFFL
jgi:GT2 family glycosyltransferase